MRKLTGLLAGLLSCLFSMVQAQENTIVVSPQWLNQQLQDPTVVVLQPAFMRLDYVREHIKGARFLWPDWLAFNSPEGSFNPPDPKIAEQVLRDLGINQDSKIILCHNFGDVSVTARMFLTLEYLGLKGRVYFLNGGLQAWKRAGFAVTNEVPDYKKGNIRLGSVAPVIVDRQFVSQALQDKNAVVVDARLKRFYDGDPSGNPRDGHIAGALNLPYPDMIDSVNCIKPADSLARRFAAVLPDKTRPAVAYCFIGQTASVIYLTGRALGYDMKVYDGSMQEWSRIPELPMEKSK